MRNVVDVHNLDGEPLDVEESVLVDDADNDVVWCRRLVVQSASDEKLGLACWEYALKTWKKERKTQAAWSNSRLSALKKVQEQTSNAKKVCTAVCLQWKRYASLRTKIYGLLLPAVTTVPIS